MRGRPRRTRKGCRLWGQGSSAMDRAAVHADHRHRLCVMEFRYPIKCNTSCCHGLQGSVVPQYGLCSPESSPDVTSPTAVAMCPPFPVKPGDWMRERVDMVVVVVQVTWERRLLDLARMTSRPGGYDAVTSSPFESVNIRIVNRQSYFTRVHVAQSNQMQAAPPSIPSYQRRTLLVFQHKATVAPAFPAETDTPLDNPHQRKDRESKRRPVDEARRPLVGEDGE